MDIPGRLGRLSPAAIRYLWAEDGWATPLEDKYLYGTLWATREAAQQSLDLNVANHGHTPESVHGPLQTDIGWATALDLRAAMVAAEERARVLKAALADTRGQSADLAAFRRRQR
jgi:hypothetical protein